MRGSNRRTSGIGSGSFATALGLAALLLGGAGPLAAQSPVSLHATMGYGLGVETDLPAGTQHAAPPVRARAEPADRLAPADSAAPDTLRDPWLGRDKMLHAAGSFLLTLSGQYVLTSKLGTSEDGALPVSACMTLSLGLAKEIADSRRPVRPLFSVRDLAADAFGVALAAGLILL